MIRPGKVVWMAATSVFFASSLAMAKPVLETAGIKRWGAVHCSVKDKDRRETEAPACAFASLDMPMWKGDAKLIAYIDNNVRRVLTYGEMPDASSPVSWQQLLEKLVRKEGAEEEWMVSVSPGGADDRTAVYLLGTYDFDGGAHGLTTSRAVVLSTETNEPVALNDILLAMKNMPSGRDKLFELAKKRAVLFFEQQNMSADEVKEMMEGDMFPFKLTDNWRPVKGGIALLYQQYEIAPYVSGLPDIFIPADELQDIVRPEILKQLKDWPVAYDDNRNTESSEYGKEHSPGMRR